MTTNDLHNFRIINTNSGLDMGIFQARDEDHALDLMAQEAGYRDHDHACEVADCDGLEVIELDDDAA